MAADGHFDAKKMLDLYIYDYMVRKNNHRTARTFAEEANLHVNFVDDSPNGFLSDWWTTFWDMYGPGVPQNLAAIEGSEASNHMTDTSQHSNAMDRRMAIQSPISLGYDKMPLNKGESGLLGPASTYLRPSSSSHAGPSPQQNPMKAPQKIPREKRQRINKGENSSMDSTLCGNPSAMLPTRGEHPNAGKKKEAYSIPSKEWLFTGMDQSASRAAYPILNVDMPSMNENQQLSRTLPLPQHGIFSQHAPTQGKQTSASQGFTSNFANLMVPMDGRSLTQGLVPTQGKQTSASQGFSNNFGNMMVPMDGQSLTQGLVPTQGKLSSASQGFTSNFGNLMFPVDGLSLTQGLMQVPCGQNKEQQMPPPGSQMFPMREPAVPQLNDQLTQHQMPAPESQMLPGREFGMPQQNNLLLAGQHYYEGGRNVEEDLDSDFEIGSFLAGDNEDSSFI